MKVIEVPHDLTMPPSFYRDFLLEHGFIFSKRPHSGSNNSIVFSYLMSHPTHCDYFLEAKIYESNYEVDKEFVPLRFILNNKSYTPTPI